MMLFVQRENKLRNGRSPHPDVRAVSSLASTRNSDLADAKKQGAVPDFVDRTGATHPDRSVSGIFMAYFAATQSTKQPLGHRQPITSRIAARLPPARPFRLYPQTG